MKAFDWNLARSFLAVMEHGSLLAAARALGASQPTLGRHVAELEAQLGVTLFERTGRGLLPTAVARQLVPRAQALEAAAQQFASGAAGAGAARGGTVRLSASQPIACFVLPSLLASMRAALPDVRVELVASNAVSNLLRREADIAVRMVQPRQASLVARRIGRFTLGVYAHRDYLRRQGVPRQPADLLAHDLLGGDADSAILHGLQAHGLPLEAEQFALRTDDLMAYWQALRAGVGIGFVADAVARSDPDVVPLLPQVQIPPLPVWLVVHRELRSSARIRAVWDFLAAGLARAL